MAKAKTPTPAKIGAAERVRTVLAAVLIVVATVFLVAPPTPRPVELTPSSVGEVAERDIITDHAFVVIHDNEAAYEGARQQALAGVRPVWDYNQDVSTLTVDRVDRAFIAMRRVLRNVAGERWERANEEHRLEQSAQRPLPPVDGSGAAPPPVEVTSLQRPDDILEFLSPEERVEVASLEGNVEEFVRALQSGVDREAFDALARDGFSMATQQALRGLVGSALELYVVPDMQVLAANRTGGLTLRTISNESVVSERHMESFERFVDADQLQRYVADRALVEFASLDPALADVLMALTLHLIDENTLFNEQETRRRQQDAVSDAVAELQEDRYAAGSVVVAAGEEIGAEHLEAYGVMVATAPDPAPRALGLAGIIVAILVMLWPIVVFVRNNVPNVAMRRKDLLMMGVVLVTQLALTRLVAFIAGATVATGVEATAPQLMVMIPFAAGTMIVKILTRSGNALLFTLAYALLIGVMFDDGFFFTALALTGSLVTVLDPSRAEHRSDIFKAGALSGAAVAGAALALSFASGATPSAGLAWMLLAAISSGVISALATNAILPIVEGLFRYTTSLKLMELANLNHPLLRDLVLKAPGTYHHSMMVGQLVEAGCDAVGADALLGRVGSYYHDIGKMKNAMYFAENQHGVNHHDKLKPTMSALIIKAHVKDGIEMAREHRLPEEVIDFIREHHGTSLIRFFYHRAQQELGDGVLESDFRYPGPKPQSRETAICMIADGIEAASRSLPEKTPDRIQGLVQKMINLAFSHGQLDECDLTLRDLNIIAAAMIQRLSAFYHHRPAYPEDKKGKRSRASDAHRSVAAPSTPAPPKEEDADDPAASEPNGHASPDAAAHDALAEDDGPRLRRLGLQ